MRLGSSVTQTSITNTTTETNIFSVSIPANTLGTANLIRVTVLISDIDFGTGAGSAFDLRLKYGSTELTSINVNSDDSKTNVNGKIEAYVFANAATNAQRAFTTINLFTTSNPTGPSGVVSDQSHVADTGTAVEDSTGALNLVLTLQWGEAQVASVFTYEGYLVEALLG